MCIQIIYMYIIVCLKFVIVYEVYILNGSVYIPNGSDNQKFKRKTVIIFLSFSRTMCL